MSFDLIGAVFNIITIRDEIIQIGSLLDQIGQVKESINNQVEEYRRLAEEYEKGTKQSEAEYAQFLSDIRSYEYYAGMSCCDLIKEGLIIGDLKKCEDEEDEDDCETLDCCPDCDDPPVIISRDPNEKHGPLGFGPRRFVGVGQELRYVINFENMPTATASAQVVTITDPLSADLDWRTFRLGEIVFGDKVVEVPVNKSRFTSDVALDNGYVARVSASLDPVTGLATWTLSTIDPATGEAPRNALIGLLPPNDPATHNGEGHAVFTVRPKATTPTGSEINNQATIIFDTNAPIDTNGVFNTVDADIPLSFVWPMDPETSQTQFNVFWSGDEPASSSGLASYDIYVSTDGAPYERWLAATTEVNAVFTAEYDHVYRFYSIARDNAGNEELPPVTPDAQVAVFDPRRPARPGLPSPADGATSVSSFTALGWPAAERAASYQLLFWRDGDATPTLSSAAVLTAPAFQPAPRLLPDTVYCWQVRALNLYGQVAGPVWRFRTLPQVSLDLAIRGQGAVNCTPDLTRYDLGTSLTLRVIPAGGCHFVSWSGPPLVAGTEPDTFALTLNGDARLTATFARDLGTVRLDVTPEGAPWALTDGDGQVRQGAGDDTVTSVPTGLVSVQWGTLANYDPPAPNPRTATLERDATVVFDGVYVPHNGNVAIKTNLDQATWTLIAPGGGVLLSNHGTTTVLRLPLGAYTVAWGQVRHYDAPTSNPLILPVNKDLTTTFTGLYVRQTGVLGIKVTPPQGPWSLLGPEGLAVNDQGTTTIRPALTGDYQLTWRSLANWDRPSPATASVTLAKDQATTVSGTFIRHSGTVRIDVTPEGAPWTLTDGDGQVRSGSGDATLSRVPSGTITAQWGALANYDEPTPNPRTGTLAKGATLNWSGVYQRHTGNLTIQSNLALAPWTLSVSGGGVLMNDRGTTTITGLPTGNYTVTWGAVANYDAPVGNPMARTITKGQTSSCVGNYVRQKGTVQINVTPDTAGWTLTDGDGQVRSGTGDAVMNNMPPGLTTLRWGSLDAYDLPVPAQPSATLAGNGTVVFTGVYLRQTGTVIVDVTPNTATWTLTDGNGSVHAGSGDRTLTGMPTGTVSLAWGALTNYVAPVPNPAQAILADHATVRIVGVYERQLGKVVITVHPDTTRWSLVDGAGLTQTGTGDKELANVAGGQVRLTWIAPTGYLAPVPAAETKTLHDKEIIQFNQYLQPQGTGPLSTREKVIRYLLGFITDKTGIDLNDDGNVDAADLILATDALLPANGTEITTGSLRRSGPAPPH